jgi:hypothetical protein
MTSESWTPDANGDLLIDCSLCPHQGTSECDDCLVAYILDRPEGAVIFDAAEERALRALRDGGLLPDVRFGRKTG